MLNEKNFLKFATQSYRNHRCLSVNEFFEDLARVKYVKRLLNRYTRTGELQERLILNHIISIYNVFDIASANEILFYRCEKETWPALKSFLVFLNYISEDHLKEYKLDKSVLSRLHSI